MIIKRALYIVLATVAALFVVACIGVALETPADRAKRHKAAAAKQAAAVAQSVIDKQTAFERKRDEADGRAWRVAKDLVTARLKAPSTATFPSLMEREEDHAVIAAGNGRYIVRSWVDSQNAFGAMIRTRWQCELKTADGEKFAVTGFEVKH